MYRLLALPSRLLLGRMGVGLADVTLAESRYEKGEDVSDAYLTLTSCQAEIQRKGTPEVEFVLTALLANCLIDRGDLDRAVEDINAFRARMEEAGEKRLLPNLDALLCRFALLTCGERVHRWLTEEAPDENDFFIMERYRYLTKVRCYLQQGNTCPPWLCWAICWTISPSTSGRWTGSKPCFCWPSAVTVWRPPTGGSI